jgi:hypothetical protein
LRRAQKMMRFGLVVVLGLALCGVAVASDDWISASSFSTEDLGNGLWYYSYDIAWDLGKDLSNWTLQVGCAHELIDEISDCGDLIPPDHNQNPFGDWAVKWDTPGFSKKGETEGGAFWFTAYSPPQDAGFWPDHVGAKYGQHRILGDLEGDLPHCIPEPSLGFLGGLVSMALAAWRELR